MKAIAICLVPLLALSFCQTKKTKVILVKGKLPQSSQAVLVKPFKHYPDAKTIVVQGVKHYEGFYKNPYICPGGVRTIGYGFTGKIANRNSITQSESNRILEQKLILCKAQVENVVLVPLTESQLWALTSFTYNCGISNLKKLVHGEDRLNGGNYDSVPKLLVKYCKANGKTLKGLERRRTWEKDVWNENI